MLNLMRTHAEQVIPPSYDEVVNDLVKKIGQPTNQTDYPDQNGYGAIFHHRLATWERPEFFATVFEVKVGGVARDGRITTSSVQVTIETPEERRNEIILLHKWQEEKRVIVCRMGDKSGSMCGIGGGSRIREYKARRVYPPASKRLNPLFRPVFILRCLDFLRSGKTLTPDIPIPHGGHGGIRKAAIVRREPKGAASCRDIQDELKAIREAKK